MNVNKAMLRQYIVDKFSLDELMTFLFDYFPNVYREIVPAMSLTRRILLLLDHCERNGRFPELFADLERERRGSFDRTDFSDEPELVRQPSIPNDQPKERNPRLIFMSHAHQDADLARRLAADLKAHNWEIWMAPDAICPGEKWVEAINRGLAESGKILLILTPEAAASSYVRDETNAAIELRRHGEPIEILPLYVKPVSPTALPFTWLSYQRIPFTEEYKDGLENLLNALQPDVMTRLNQLYDQLKLAVGGSDWNAVQIVGDQILEQYTDYRETVQLVALAKREAKREAMLQKETEHLYQQLKDQIADEEWDIAAQLVEQIQERVKNYRHLARLAAISKMVREKQRQQNEQEKSNNQVNEPKQRLRTTIAIELRARLQSLLAKGLAQLNNLRDVGSIGRRKQQSAEADFPDQQAEQPKRQFTKGWTLFLIPFAFGISWFAFGFNNGPPIIAGLDKVWERPRDNMEMVYVPGGRFMMGSDLTLDSDAEKDEFPQHEVTLGSFWIDRTEVTNAQFASFLNAQGNQVDIDFTWLDMDGYDVSMEIVNGKFQPISGFEHHPVNHVSWYGANAYCKWVGGILPTEAQWEYAARGNNGRIFPWGDAFDGTNANYCDASCARIESDETFNDGNSKTSPVTEYEESGISWIGAADLSGNVWEWVADWYDEAYYEASASTNPLGPQIETAKKVLRGGGWDTISSNLRTANRYSLEPGHRMGNVGFRCSYPTG